MWFVVLLSMVISLWLSYADGITKSDLQVLSLDISGDIEFPDEHSECLLSDKMAFTSYTCPYQNSLAIISPESSNDVSKIIKFITNFDTDFRIKSSGQSIGGYSKCEQCININLERMKEIEYKLGSMIDSSLIADNIYMEIESGAQMLRIDESARDNQYNVRTQHCDSSNTTAGGFYQSGGWTETIRQYGYASDSVIGVEIVLYDGQILTVFDNLNEDSFSSESSDDSDSDDSDSDDSDSDDSDSDDSDSDDSDECEYEKDLLWALRGSGGGSFGIITKYYMKTVPLESSDDIMIFTIKYKLVSKESGKKIYRACHQFTQYTDIGYKIGCGLWPETPNPEAPNGYFFRFEGKYIGNNMDEANQTLYDILLNDEIYEYVTKLEIDYPPNDYVDNFIYNSGRPLNGIMNTRMVKSWDVLSDDGFYDAFMEYVVDTVGLVDLTGGATRCVCGAHPGCNQCIPGVTDYLTCCGVGVRTLFFLYGDSVYNADPNNCYTSAPNRDCIGRFAIIVGSALDTKEHFMSLRDTVIRSLLQEGIDNVLNPYLGNQNFIGYRDDIDSTIDKYFGAGNGNNNEMILTELKKIKCKYDPYDVFNHPLTIPAENCEHK